MSNYGYGGGRQNPYDQRSDSPAQGGAPYPTGGYDAYGAPPAQQYGRQQYGAPVGGRDEYSGQNVELEPLAPNGQQFGRQNNPNAILDECREIDRGIASVQIRLGQLQDLQRVILNDVDSNSNNSRRLEDMSTEIMATYRNLTGRVKAIKSKPESGTARNAPQVGKVGRQLKDAITAFRRIDKEFQDRLKDQSVRQYRIVRPDASVAEAEEAVLSGQPIFSQALMQSNRRADAESTMNAVRSRHEDIQKLERQMIELAELFQDMDNLVVQQEAAVTNIEMKGEEVVENMDKGTEQIGVAVKSARNARKWKWWCLGISVLVIIIIVIIVLLYQFVFGPNAKSNRDKTQQKRFVIPSDLTAEIISPGQPFDADSKIVVPGLEWTHNNELVRKTKRFEA